MGWQNFWFLPSGWKIDGQWWGRGDVTGGKEFPGSLVIWPAGHWLRANSQTGWFIHIWPELQNYKKTSKSFGWLGCFCSRLVFSNWIFTACVFAFQKHRPESRSGPTVLENCSESFFLTKNFKVQSILNANTLFYVDIDHTVNVFHGWDLLGSVTTSWRLEDIKASYQWTQLTFLYKWDNQGSLGIEWTSKKLSKQRIWTKA